MALFNDNRPTLRSFLDLRSQINRVYLILLIIAYISFYFLVVPFDTPYPSMVFTVMVTPLLVFGLYFRTVNYFFVRNWFHIIYLIATTTIFFYVMTFVVRDYENNIGGYEFYHALISNFIGICTAIAVSIPFKIVYCVLWENESFYYRTDIITKVEKEAYPEKQAKVIEKKKEAMKYDTLNETQLHAELNNAIKEDRYEDAEKIKKILDTKFR